MKCPQARAHTQTHTHKHFSDSLANNYSHVTMFWSKLFKEELVVETYRKSPFNLSSFIQYKSGTKGGRTERRTRRVRQQSCHSSPATSAEAYLADAAAISSHCFNTWTCYPTNTRKIGTICYRIRDSLECHILLAASLLPELSPVLRQKKKD